MGRFSTVMAFSMVLWAPTMAAQHPPGQQGSSNVKILSHIPLGRIFTIGDIEIEQELSRPYAYVPRLHGTTHSAGFNIIDLKDPTNARMLYEWRIENPELHQGIGALDNKYFKVGGRYYDVQSMQWRQGGPNADLGAVVFDVTGLPDTASLREVARIRAPSTPGGFHNIFAYKHSNGRALLFTTVGAPFSNIYDLEKLVAGAGDYGLTGRVPIPNPTTSRGYHDLYLGYDPATRQDKFYGGGAGGYYIYDVSQIDQPRLLTSLTGIAGITGGHTFTPTPDGHFAVAETEYQYAPLRLFDLRPGLEGDVETISRPIGAWISNWRTNPHNHEVRWPYVFVSAYEEGLQIFNMMDPTNLYTVGYYDTYDGPHEMGRAPFGNPESRWIDRSYPIPPMSAVVNGSFGVDIRNADGLIVTSDMATGFWALKMDGFDGWNGHQWGMPNISSAQDWDNGPDGAPAPASVSLLGRE